MIHDHSLARSLFRSHAARHLKRPPTNLLAHISLMVAGHAWEGSRVGGRIIEFRARCHHYLLTTTKTRREYVLGSEHARSIPVRRSRPSVLPLRSSGAVCSHQGETRKGRTDGRASSGALLSRTQQRRATGGGRIREDAKRWTAARPPARQRCVRKRGVYHGARGMATPHARAERTNVAHGRFC